MIVEPVTAWNIVRDPENSNKDLLIREGDRVKVDAGESNILITGTITKLTMEEMYIYTSKGHLYSVHKERLNKIERTMKVRRLRID